MNDAIIATYEVHDPEMQLDSMAGRTGQSSRKHSAGGVHYLLNTAGNASNQLTIEAHADRQVREDKEFYIPNFLSDEQHDSNPEANAAAVDHAKHLGEAERLLGEALNLVGLMLASLGDEGDSRAMQIDTGLKIIEKKLSKAYNRIDKHDARHTNLFLAYFDLKGKADGGEPS